MKNLMPTEPYRKNKKKNRRKYAIAEEVLIQTLPSVNKVNDTLVRLVLKHQRCRGTQITTDNLSQALYQDLLKGAIVPKH